MLRTILAVDWLQLLFVRYRWLARLSAVALCILAGLAGGWLVATAGPFITTGLVLGVAGGLWILRDIEVGYWSLVAVICLLPFGKLPVDVGFKPSFLDLVSGGLFVVWLAELMFAPSTGSGQAPSASRRGELAEPHRGELAEPHRGELAEPPEFRTPTSDAGRSQFIGTRLGLPIFVFTTLAVMSFIAGLAHAPLTRLVARHFAEVILSILMFFVVVNTVRQPDRLARLTRVIILGGFAAAVVGIVLYFLPESTSIDLLSALGRFDYPVGPGVLRYIREDPSLPQRATGTSVDPNVLGGLLIMSGALTAPQLFARRPLFSRRLVILFAGTMGLGLMLTFSRNSFIGLGTALVALALLRYRKLLLLLIGILILIWVLPLTQDYVTHFIQGLRGQDLATQMRIGEYRDAITLIRRYPVLGVGFAGSPDIDTYISVASVYLLMAVEMGLVGLASFLVVIGVLWARAARTWHRLRRDSLLEPIWYGHHAALLGALVGGILDHYFFNLDFHHSVTFFWLFVGLATAASRLAPADETPT